MRWSRKHPKPLSSRPGDQLQAVEQEEPFAAEVSLPPDIEFSKVDLEDKPAMPLADADLAPQGNVLASPQEFSGMDGATQTDWDSPKSRVFTGDGFIPPTNQGPAASKGLDAYTTANRGLLGMPHWAWAVVGLALVGLVIGLVYLLGGGLPGFSGRRGGITQTPLALMPTTPVASPEPTQTAADTPTPLPPSPTAIPQTDTPEPTPTLTPRFPGRFNSNLASGRDGDGLCPRGDLPDGRF